MLFVFSAQSRKRVLGGRNSVCISVCPYVRHVHCDKIYKTTTYIVTTLEAQFVVVNELTIDGGRPLHLKVRPKMAHLFQKRRLRLSKAW